MSTRRRLDQLESGKNPAAVAYQRYLDSLSNQELRQLLADEVRHRRTFRGDAPCTLTDAELEAKYADVSDAELTEKLAAVREAKIDKARGTT